jgi:hypothetical protein
MLSSFELSALNFNENRFKIIHEFVHLHGDDLIGIGKFIVGVGQ